MVLVMFGGVAMAIEEPGYAVVREGPDFELRRYQPQLLAETEVRGRFDQAGGKAFRILADYIFGNNQAAEKIAMTAPVSQRPAEDNDQDRGTRIEMTAPVTQRAANAQTGRFMVSFVITHSPGQKPTSMVPLLGVQGSAFYASLGSCAKD
jgi:hypothetical protein